MKSKYGEVVQRITALLQEFGPMTRTDMCVELNLDRMNVSAVVTRMSKATETTPKRVYISHYIHSVEGARDYPRAVYALGDKPDAKKPKRDHAKTLATKRRYNAKIRKLNTMNSVFNLGLTRKEFRI
jgi:hypothetical protein